MSTTILSLAGHQRAIKPPVGPLAAMIRQRREAMRISQSRLANRLCLSHGYISRIESGTRVFDHVLIPTLAEVMDLDPHDLALAIAGFDPVVFRLAVVAEAEPGIRADERRRIVVMIEREAA